MKPAAAFSTATVPAGIAALLALPCLAQDIEPRRWSHLPIGANFAGLGYAYSSGDITFNPVLRIEDGQFDLDTAAVQYIHSFELLGKSARFDFAQAYQGGTWEGLLNGVPAFDFSGSGSKEGGPPLSARPKRTATMLPLHCKPAADSE